MCVHIFGAVSSPACANWALRQTAYAASKYYGDRIVNLIANNFYVDDCLLSFENEDIAVQQVKDLKSACICGGFNLTKFVSNSKAVLQSMPAEDRSDVSDDFLKDLSSLENKLTIERALGVQWCIENDTLNFRITLESKPPTRRGILSTVSSIYDPFGFLCPVILVAKRILQELTADGNLKWDDPLEEDVKVKWETWKRDLGALRNLKIPRCINPSNNVIKDISIHHFSDTSQIGYGMASYLRIEDNEENIHISLISAKARVSPIQNMQTVPRLELTATSVSARIGTMITAELKYGSDLKEIFWTDSTAVLKYIRNEARRFSVFVCNRVQHIRERTLTNQWKYVPSSSNPADDASRGCSAKQLVCNERWFNGPKFLSQAECTWPSQNIDVSLLLDDEEVRRIKKSCQSTTTLETLSSKFEKFSDWYRLTVAIAVILRAIKYKRLNKVIPKTLISVQERKNAEIEILKIHQNEKFEQEIKILQKQKDSKSSLKGIPRSSRLFKLDPFIDDFGLIRVGGRLRKTNLTERQKYQVIIASKCHIANLLIKHCHERIHHRGRNFTVFEILQSGYWILKCNTSVKSYIHRCTTCRRLRGSVGQQKLADLPPCRTDVTAPFVITGVDNFGPFFIKQRRSEVKRYCVMFTCLSSRAVHIEVSPDMTTDAFINALRRFIARRGPVSVIYCDQGTNLLGARNELKVALQNLDNSEISMYLRKGDIQWKVNSPHSSHMGGVWERQIRTLRSIFEAILKDASCFLTDDTFVTFMTEAENIMNSRPLTSLPDSPDDLMPLCPNHLLTLKQHVVIPPPGIFQAQDFYHKRRWKQVQHLANEFWKRWRKEIIHQFQIRQKWQRERRNFEKGDIVLLKEDAPRNHWQLAVVEETIVSQDDRVRRVKIAIIKRERRIILERPVSTLVFVEGAAD